MLAMVIARIHQEVLFVWAALAMQAMLPSRMDAQVHDANRKNSYELLLLYILLPPFQIIIGRFNFFYVSKHSVYLDA
jgi:hypothetical protein